MCGNYSMKHQTYEFIGVLENLGPAEGFGLAGRNEIVPGKFAAAIYETKEKRRADTFMFGRQTEKQHNLRRKILYNLRSERIHTLPKFKDAFLKRRCMIPCDGWTDFVAVSDAPESAASRKAAGLTRNGKRKIYCSIPVANDPNGALFYLAGVHGRGQWKSDKGWQETRCMIMLTTAANNQISEAGKNRQPVIIQPQHYGAWLSPENNDVGALLDMLTSREYEGLVIQPVRV